MGGDDGYLPEEKGDSATRNNIKIGKITVQHSYSETEYSNVFDMLKQHFSEITDALTKL